MSETYTTARPAGNNGVDPVACRNRRRKGVRVCHFHGNSNSYNVAVSFLESGELTGFHTSIYDPFGIGRRCHPELPRRCVTTHPVWETARLASRALPFKRWNGEQQWFVDFVSRQFDRVTAAALTEKDYAVYCYEDSAAMTFARASQLGIRRIYELPILHYRQMRSIFQPEVDRYPELKAFFQSCQESQWKLDQKDEELASAEVIVVPATFVRESIERFLSVKARFVVASYGADTSTEIKQWTKADERGPLQLIFVGSLGPRKGLHILFEALTKIPSSSYRLTLVGRWEGEFRAWLTARYSIEYDWAGPLSPADVHAAYRRSHVMVFPSLAEGYGLVIPEAMASGIPIITTERTAGIDLIENDVEGWIVPAGSAEGLRARILNVIENRPILPELGAAARRRAQLLTWHKYRQTLRDGVAAALASDGPEL